jgi:predicted aconitase
MADTVSADYVGSMRLSEADRAMLTGDRGEATRIAMELLIAAGEAMEAPELVDISRAHIDSCLYHGIAGLDFSTCPLSTFSIPTCIGGMRLPPSEAGSR